MKVSFFRNFAVLVLATCTATSSAEDTSCAVRTRSAQSRIAALPDKPYPPTRAEVSGATRARIADEAVAAATRSDETVASAAVKTHVEVSEVSLPATGKATHVSSGSQATWVDQPRVWMREVNGEGELVGPSVVTQSPSVALANKVQQAGGATKLSLPATDQPFTFSGRTYATTPLELEIHPTLSPEELFHLAYPKAGMGVHPKGKGGFNLVFQDPELKGGIKLPNFQTGSMPSKFPELALTSMRSDQVTGPALRDVMKSSDVEILIFEAATEPGARALGSRTTPWRPGPTLSSFLVKNEKAIYVDGAFPKLRAQIAKFNMNRRIQVDGKTTEVDFFLEAAPLGGKPTELEMLDYQLLNYWQSQGQKSYTVSPRMVFGENGLPIIEEVLIDGKKVRKIKAIYTPAGVDVNARNLVVVPDGPDDFRLVGIDY